MKGIQNATCRNDVPLENMSVHRHSEEEISVVIMAKIERMNDVN